MSEEPEIPDEPNHIQVLDFGRCPFTFTWFYRALALSDTAPPVTSPFYGQRRTDVVDRFLSLWICFNSILRDNYAEDWTDSDLISCLVNDEWWHDYFRSASSPEYRKNLNELKKYSPIVDMKKPHHLTSLNEDGLEQLIPFIYQVRNNLFHGRKDPEDVELGDMKRIELSYLLLLPLITVYMEDANLIRTRFQIDFEYKWAKNGIWFEF